MTTWPGKCTVPASLTVTTVPPWMTIMRVPSWSGVRSPVSRHSRLGRHTVRKRSYRGHPVRTEREYGHRIHAHPGQVPQVLAGLVLAAGQRHPLDELDRQRLRGPGRLLELAAGVTAADLVDDLLRQAGQPAVHRRGLREPGGDGAGRGDGRLLVI